MSTAMWQTTCKPVAQTGLWQQAGRSANMTGWGNSTAGGIQAGRPIVEEACSRQRLIELRPRMLVKRWLHLGKEIEQVLYLCAAALRDNGRTRIGALLASLLGGPAYESAVKREIGCSHRVPANTNSDVVRVVVCTGSMAAEQRREACDGTASAAEQALRAMGARQRRNSLSGSRERRGKHAK